MKLNSLSTKVTQDIYWEILKPIMRYAKKNLKIVENAMSAGQR